MQDGDHFGLCLCGLEGGQARRVCRCGKGNLVNAINLATSKQTGVARHELVDFGSRRHGDRIVRALGELFNQQRFVRAALLDNERRIAVKAGFLGRLREQTPVHETLKQLLLNQLFIDACGDLRGAEFGIEFG